MLKATLVTGQLYSQVKLDLVYYNSIQQFNIISCLNYVCNYKESVFTHTKINSQPVLNKTGNIFLCSLNAFVLTEHIDLLDLTNLLIYK